MEHSTEWRFGVVANITQSHIDAEGVQRYGTKAFTSGTKVYLGGKCWDKTAPTIGVIGQNRFGKMVVESVPVELLENVRTQRIYEPKVLAIMGHLEAMDGWVWWQRTVVDRKDTEQFVKIWGETIKQSHLTNDDISKLQNEETFYTDCMDRQFIDFFNDDEKLELQKDDYLSINIAAGGSVRLRNCLVRASKPRLGDVLFMTKARILKIRNFGRKCFEELYVLTKALLDGKELPKANTPYFRNTVDKLRYDGSHFTYTEIKQLYSKHVEEIKEHLNDKEYYPEKSLGWYICVVHTSLQYDSAVSQDLSDESIRSEYTSHKKDYPLLYDEICNFLELFINASLKDREKEVLMLRLGIKCKELVLQQVGERIGVTRERVRQNEKRGKRILISKLNKLPMNLYDKVLVLKERIYTIGLGGFVLALIKFGRKNLAKFITHAFFEDKDAEYYLRVKHYYQSIV